MVDIGQIHSSITLLDQWLCRNGWAGYDPYDLIGSPFFLKLQRQEIKPARLSKALSRLFLGLEYRYPLMMRQLLVVKKQVNAKGMGLLAKGYLNLYEVSKNEEFKRKALECLSWLREYPSPGYSGISWGYPFDWQSKVFIPKGTPSAVVSSIVGDAFWEAYRCLGDPVYLEVCDNICAFFRSDLNISDFGPERICFSYTPVDHFHVHNANLFAAEFLVRVGNELNKKDYIDLGLKAANYSTSEQNQDGSIYYWGRDQDNYSPHHLDHYHSGFEIRSLYALGKHTSNVDFQDAAKRYYNFYQSNFWEKSKDYVIPKMSPSGLYPVDIHTCAEALICNAELKDDFPRARELLNGAIPWIIKTMQTLDGWFIYQIRSENRRVKVPYIRWGQAWMLLALSTTWKHAQE